MTRLDIARKLKEYPVYADMVLSEDEINNLACIDRLERLEIIEKLVIGLLMREQILLADLLYGLPSVRVKAWIDSHRTLNFYERHPLGVPLAEPMAPPNPILQDLQDLQPLGTSETDHTDSEAGQGDGNSEASESPPKGSE